MKYFFLGRSDQLKYQKYLQMQQLVFFDMQVKVKCDWEYSNHTEEKLP